MITGTETRVSEHTQQAVYWLTQDNPTKAREALETLDRNELIGLYSLLQEVRGLAAGVIITRGGTPYDR